LQIVDDLLQCGRGQLDCLRNSLLQTRYPFAHVLHLVQIILPRGFLRDLCEA
jgi:hypothetical protein